MLLELDYEYDNRDLVTYVAESGVGVPNGLPMNNNYEYDSRGRLTEEKRWSTGGMVVRHWSYEYDQGGNRTKAKKCQGPVGNEDVVLEIHYEYVSAHHNHS